jgi:hypothetical protein
MSVRTELILVAGFATIALLGSMLVLAVLE